jgi:phosphoribosylamine--glycine ligase
MKLLILGDDGRAHAFVWKLFNSPLVDEVVCAPGNGGTGQIVPSVEIDVADGVTVGRWAFDEGFDLIVPADSRSLLAGVVDEVIALQIGVCGPPQRTMALERSRYFAKEFLLRHGLPTATGRAFDNLAIAEKYLAAQPLPVMIKGDHPAAGEAVFHDRYAALEGLRELFSVRPIEGPSNGVVIEAYLAGPRVVLSAFTDGRSAVPLLAVRLYDRVESDDSGPVARGIGAHTGASNLAQRITEYLHQRAILPLVAALAKDGLPYWGILSIDCIVTAEGPRLTAVRSSMREGEAQVVLPRLEDDLLPWIQAMIAQRLHEQSPPRWAPMATVGIGLIARGYPAFFPTGGVVSGFESLDEGVLVFHSATENPAALRYTPARYSSRSGGLFGLMGSSPLTPTLRVAGGHVVTVVASGATLAGARGRALVNAEQIVFEGRTFRDDIGAKEFG